MIYKTHGYSQWVRNSSAPLTIILFLIIISFSSSAQVITTMAGGGTSGLSDLGQATAASIGYFGGIALDALGNLYIADGNNNRVRKVDVVTGIITTVAGTGTAGFLGDNGSATTAQLNSPQYITLDASGNLYISDVLNRRIRKVTPVGIISTFAGNGVMGSSGDGGPATAATLTTPQGMVADKDGNLYISDVVSRIRKVDIIGNISTIAGNGIAGFSGDGGAATAAELNEPEGVALDSSGNLYIADYANNRIRRVDLHTGMISTVAGNSTGGYTGDGMPATASALDGPAGIAFNSYNNFYVGDMVNNRVRMVDSVGIIHTVAGTGLPGFSGDNGLATIAQLYDPEGVGIDTCGNLYIADQGNKRVRKITLNPFCWPEGIENTTLQTITIYPNPAYYEVHIDNINEQTNYRVLSITAICMQQGALQKGSNDISVQSLPSGMYMIEVTDSKGTRIITKIIKQ